jgi:hypothetical protein
VKQKKLKRKSFRADDLSKLIYYPRDGRSYNGSIPEPTESPILQWKSKKEEKHSVEQSRSSYTIPPKTTSYPTDSTGICPFNYIEPESPYESTIHSTSKYNHSLSAPPSFPTPPNPFKQNPFNQITYTPKIKDFKEEDPEEEEEGSQETPKNF